MYVFHKNPSKESSVKQINIKSITDNILELPNNEHRVIIETGSVNIELRSEEEQDKLIDSYQTFLNALPCNIQILFRVKEIDLDDYTSVFVSKMKQETDYIYSAQIKNYSSFVKELIKSNKILTRSFYIVVPFKAESNQSIDVIKQQLSLNVEIVCRGLNKLGIKTRTLSTLEILELFYSFYNPTQLKLQPLTVKTLKFLNNSSF